VLVTDRGIINLWVARMIMMGLEFRGREPFSDVIIHATIMDDAGQRMSKSKGTGVDPLILMEQFGADALRFGLALSATGSQDFRFGKNLSVRRTEQARNFITKFWNACRFVAASAEGVPAEAGGLGEGSKSLILYRLNRTTMSSPNRSRTTNSAAPPTNFTRSSGMTTATGTSAHQETHRRKERPPDAGSPPGRKLLHPCAHS
jgi:valyl-tRNA synthetase